MGLDMYLIRGTWEDDHEEVGYWRKANQIHKWFVDNVQDGVDDCGEYKVTKEQLIETVTKEYNEVKIKYFNEYIANQLIDETVEEVVS